MLKEIQENVNKWKKLQYAWMENNAKVIILPKLIYRQNAIPFRISALCSVEVDKLILNFTWNQKIPRMAKSILRKKNEVGGFIYPVFKTY